jgi:hypothetical protein
LGQPNHASRQWRSQEQLEMRSGRASGAGPLEALTTRACRELRRLAGR